LKQRYKNSKVQMAVLVGATTAVFIEKFEVCFWTVNDAGTRAFATNCCDLELSSRTNAFIQEHIQAVVERSQEFLQIPLIIFDIVGKYCYMLLVIRDFICTFTVRTAVEFHRKKFLISSCSTMHEHC